MITYIAAAEPAADKSHDLRAVRGMRRNDGVRSRVGIVLTNSDLKILFANAESVHILHHGVSPQGLLAKPLERRLHEITRSFCLRSPFVADFRSGKRHYLCWAFPLDAPSNVIPANDAEHPTLAFLLLRSLIGAVNIDHAARFYTLTPREQAAVGLLVQGLPYKEIATQMNVSFNTVKSFLRLAMSKARATTRTELIKKILDHCYIGFGSGVSE